MLVELLVRALFVKVTLSNILAGNNKKSQLVLSNQ